MSALEVLRDRGPMPAVDVAHYSGMALVDVYAELVAAESAGLCLIRVMGAGRAGHRREWVAL